MAQLAARQIVALEVVRSKLTCVKAFFFFTPFHVAYPLACMSYDTVELSL